MKKEEKNKDFSDDEKNKKFNLEIILTITAGVLFFFFVLPCFHNWANSLGIKLHFCNHLACMIYSLIWLVFTVVGIYYLFKKKKMSKNWIIIYFVVLIIGIILMNLISCDVSGKMSFNVGDFSFKNKDNPNNLKKDLISKTNSFLNNRENNSNSSIWVDNVLNCTDTDGGFNPEVRGEIYGLADGDMEITGSDYCSGGYILGEFYCEGDNYFMERVNCEEYFGSSYAYCENGSCELTEEVDCNDICNAWGFSNYRGPFDANCSKCNFYESCCGSHESHSSYEYDFVCCCSDNTTKVCADYASDEGYEHWILTSDSCEEVATADCDGSLESFFVQFSAEGLDCCIWNCKPSIPIENCTDNDGDYYAIEGGDCGIFDCDDTNSDINPGAIENCTDGFDNNCNNLIDCDDSYCEEQEICKTPCEDSEKPTCGGYCPEDYTCKYSEGNDCCYCEK